MDVTNALLAPEPHQSLAVPADHAEFFPLTDFAALLPPHARQVEPAPIRLETTGVTSQSKQSELFNRQLLYKSSVEAKLREAGMLDAAETLAECHSRQSWAQCTNCSRVKTFWNRCDNFFCPACQPHLSRERADSIRFWTRYVKQPKHVVLTARNSATITFKQVKLFKLAITRLRRSKLARNWRGGCWSLEVTNEGRGWHLHAHLLVDSDWIDKPSLAVKWGQLVGQDFAIVDVADCREKDYLKEVTKYAVKGSELARWTPNDIAHFIHAFQKQRTFGVFGSLYGKRGDWKEWLAIECAERKRCECGCEQWRIYSETEWASRELFCQVKSGKSLPPPQNRPNKPQLDLLHVQFHQDGLVTIS